MIQITNVLHASADIAMLEEGRFSQKDLDR